MAMERVGSSIAEELTGLAFGDYSDVRLAKFKRVQNHVVLTNPNVVHPQLQFAENQPTDAAFFVHSPADAAHADEAVVYLEIWPENHHRSALLERIPFTDELGIRYRDIDYKGVGDIDIDRQTKKVVILTPGLLYWQDGDLVRERKGLLSKKDAMHDYGKTEELARLGIRTARTLAIILLDELIIDGNTVSLADAIEAGILDGEFNPVIQVRAFATKARIRDLISKDRVKMLRFREDPIRNVLFEDAKSLVSEELGQDEISDEDYLVWFAQTLGSNVGLLHKAGYAHRFLYSHNITLDCRLVDFDSIRILEDEKQREHDLRTSLSSLHALAKLVKPELREELEALFLDNYSEVTGI
ncbi:MAG: hypothetical protein HY430_02330 [Candidatus Levybacteria bacterium]|nr:hypothetical protein [Candidatus Levybacteria bacterium]